MVFYDETDNALIGVSSNLSYLFQGLHRGITVLSEETYVDHAAYQPPSPRSGNAPREASESPVIVRWSEDKFPLQVCITPDYGFLFSPLERRHLSHVIQATFDRVTELDPQTFTFQWVSTVGQADLVVRLRRGTLSQRVDKPPQLGRACQIVHADLVVCVSQSAPADRFRLDLLHQILHAMGVMGHSPVASDTAAKDWSPQQRPLTARDVKTLQLLYRCPMGLSIADLKLLWEIYQQRYLTWPQSEVLDTILSRLPDHDILSLPKGLVPTPGELSVKELTLRQWFDRFLQEIRTA